MSSSLQRTMDFFFLDDAGQPRPSRKVMGSLLSVGGIHIPEEILKTTEQEIEGTCLSYGFPPDEPFKWSPKKEHWMHENLKSKEREDFFVSFLAKLKEFDVTAWIIIEDTKYNTATGVQRHDIDLTHMFLERIHFALCSRDVNGIAIVSQPSGDRNAENEFLTECTGILKGGTTFTSLERVSQIFSLNHKFSRLLQAADLITSCSTAYVSGEDRFSPSVFESVKPLLGRERERIGGAGLKLHPDIQYVNLYHWLLGDSTFIKRNMGFGMPLPNYPYSSSPNEP